VRGRYRRVHWRKKRRQVIWELGGTNISRVRLRDIIWEVGQVRDWVLKSGEIHLSQRHLQLARGVVQETLGVKIRELEYGRVSRSGKDGMDVIEFRGIMPGPRLH
jgi:hypothetical protein